MSDDKISDDDAMYYDLERPSVKRDGDGVVIHPSLDELYPELIGDTDDDVDRVIEETKSGVKVTIKSERGAAPRDEDSVKVESHHDSLDEAAKKSSRRISVLREDMKKARRSDPNKDRDQ